MIIVCLLHHAVMMLCRWHLVPVCLSDCWVASLSQVTFLLTTASLSAELHSTLSLFNIHTCHELHWFLVLDESTRMMIGCALLLLGNKGLIDLWMYKQKLLQWLLMERIKQVTTTPESVHELNKRLSTHLEQNLAFGKAVWCSLYVGVLLLCYMMIVHDIFLSTSLVFSVICQRFNYHTYCSHMFTETPKNLTHVEKEAHNRSLLSWTDTGHVCFRNWGSSPAR